MIDKPLADLSNLECGTMHNKFKKLQGEKLKQIVTYTYENFSFYREKMNKINIRPTDINGLEDLEKLPYTTKEELQKKINFDEFFQQTTDKLYYIGFTTGTSATPMPVYYTHDDFNQWEKNLVKGLFMAGIAEKDVVQITIGRCGIGCIVLLGAVRRTGAAGMPIDADSGTASELLRQMGKFHVSFLLAYPSIVREFCRLIETNKVESSRYLKKIFLMGESWSEAFRKRVEDTLNAEVYNIYGSTEVGMVGVECSSHDGLHILPGQILVEIINPSSGKTANQGEEGEIVVTTFWKKALPFIRYRTGDIASIIDGDCNCGSDLPRISKIVGRKQDLIFIGSTKIHLLAIETSIIDVCDIALNYQILLDEEEGKEKLKVVIETPKDVTDRENLQKKLIERVSELNADFAALIKANIILHPEVEFVPINTLPRKRGKIKKFIDLRGKEI